MNKLLIVLAVTLFGPQYATAENSLDPPYRIEIICHSPFLSVSHVGRFTDENEALLLSKRINEFLNEEHKMNRCSVKVCQWVECGEDHAENSLDPPYRVDNDN